MIKRSLLFKVLLSIIPALFFSCSAYANYGGEIDIIWDLSEMRPGWEPNTPAEIIITGAGLEQPYVIYNSNWGTKNTYPIIGLPFGTYTINVSKLYKDDYRFLGYAMPETVTINNSAPTWVKIDYWVTYPK